MQLSIINGKTGEIIAKYSSNQHKQAWQDMFDMKKMWYAVKDEYCPYELVDMDTERYVLSDGVLGRKVLVLGVHP